MKKIFFISVLLLTSCTLYQAPKIPPLKIPEKFKVAPAIKNSPVNNNWWQNFHDPELNQLIDTAVKNNYNYQISLKNIDIAATYVSQNISSLFPQGNLGFNSSRTKPAPAANPANPHFSSAFNLQQLSGTVSYQVDFWNQIRNSIKQAEAAQAVSEADARGVKLTVISSVVNVYFQIKSLNANIINLNNQLSATQEIAKLNNTQYKSGLIDYSVVDAAQTQVETIKINISNLEKQKQITEYTLAYILGEYPENFTQKLDNGITGFKQFNLIPSGIPAQVVCNRPDIQDAYNQILSYGYLEKESIANFLPNIMLTGQYGYASAALGGLLKSSNAFWTLGLFSTQYLFDFGGTLSQYHRAKYQYESAILNYKNVVLNSFKEIDSALISYKEDNEGLHSYQSQAYISADQLKLAHAKYASGITDYPTYLTVKLADLQSEYNLNNQKLLVVQDISAVYVSLGVGA